MASTFNAKELADLKGLFEEYDKNKDGHIKKEELWKLTRDHAESVSHDDVDRIFSAFDTSEDGVLDYQEFLSFMEALKS
ncbi:hypothetical protein BGZ94_008986 [Podila epigama]|nr:hypothetical protein BGZ94_008986 [Podila epigama]